MAWVFHILWLPPVQCMGSKVVSSGPAGLATCWPSFVRRADVFPQIFRASLQQISLLSQMRLVGFGSHHIDIKFCTIFLTCSFFCWKFDYTKILCQKGLKDQNKPVCWKPIVFCLDRRNNKYHHHRCTVRDSGRNVFKSSPTQGKHKYLDLKGQFNFLEIRMMLKLF